MFSNRKARYCDPMTRFPSMLSGWVLALLSNCNPEKPATTVVTPFRPYDLGAITVQIPATWQALEYARTGLAPARKGQRYLFKNSQSVDTVLRETIVFTITHRSGTASFAHADKHLVTSLAEGEGLDQINVRQFSDTLLTNPAGELAIVDLDARLKARPLDLLGVYAFYRRDSLLVNVVATGLRTSDRASEQKRALFQKVIHSIQWK